MQSRFGIVAAMKRPSYDSLTAAEALKRDWSGWHLSRKMDGCFEWQGDVCGERMPDGSFWPFDIATTGDWRERSVAMAAAFQDGWQRIQEGQGSAFIADMVQCARRDGTLDVAVAKRLDAGFGETLVKIKLSDTFDCRVTDTGDGKLSIGIELDGKPAGRCPVRNLAALESLRIGDVVEVAGTMLPSGKIREPRFIRTRPDKS